ncbi:MAG: T9SS type A sorting domain-containing protein [Chlorobi bacterium]|nr:T9SS type A sorting domain-containing protein [Chlorobiota bacterium]
MFRVLTLILFLVSSVCTFSQILDYQNISESSIPSSNSKMIFDNNYNLHFTWLDSTNQIFYRYREENTWSERILVYETDSTEITELAISSYNDSVRIFLIEKGNSFKIKSISLPSKIVTQLYESNFAIQNTKITTNSTNHLLTWLEEEDYQSVKVMDLDSKDTLTLGRTNTPFSYSVSKDDSGKIFVFWLSGNNSIFYKSFYTDWSETSEVIIEGEAQPLLEMDCVYNSFNRKFNFVFTGNIPVGGNYPTDLFYWEGNDSTWSTIVSLDPPIQFCTNPQIEIFEDEYVIVLYQDGFIGQIDPNSKFYYARKYYDHGFTDTLFAPDSSTLNDFITDGSRLYCSFAKNNDVFFGDIDIITPEVNKNDMANIYSFNLEQNYPNPFNPSTTINYSIPNVGSRQASKVQLKIYNILGQEIATLVNQVQNSGSYQIQFDAASLPNGVYFYKLQYGAFAQSRKMIILK